MNIISKREANKITVPNEIEVSTAINWLALDTVRATSIGSENTYYIDQFGNAFFCKNMPDNDLVGWGVVYAPSSTYQ